MLKDIAIYELNMDDPFKHKIILKRRDGSVIKMIGVHPDRSLDMFFTIKQKLDTILLQKDKDNANT